MFLFLPLSKCSLFMLFEEESFSYLTDIKYNCVMYHSIEGGFSMLFIIFYVMTYPLTCAKGNTIIIELQFLYVVWISRCEFKKNWVNNKILQQCFTSFFLENQNQGKWIFHRTINDELVFSYCLYLINLTLLLQCLLRLKGLHICVIECKWQKFEYWVISNILVEHSIIQIL